MSRSRDGASNSLEAMGQVSNSLEAKFASHASDFLVRRSTIGCPSFYMVMWFILGATKRASFHIKKFQR
jgi:hypothetical protein